MDQGSLSVSAGEYKGIRLQPMQIMVSQEAISTRLMELLNRTAREISCDGPIRTGDTVQISFDGRIGERSFFGSRCDACELVVGSEKLVAGFEEHLVGHCIGDDFEFAINFPTHHIIEALQGRDVRFHVQVNSIRRKTEVFCSDEYVRQVSEFTSIAELHQSILEQMEAENHDEMMRYLKGCARSILAETADVSIPERYLEDRTREAARELKEALSAQGIGFDEYLKRENRTEDMLLDDLRTEAKKGIVSSLALLDIAEREGIEATEEDIRYEIEMLSAVTGSAREDIENALSQAEFVGAMRQSIRQDKALDFVLDNAHFVGEGGDRQ